MTICVVDYTVCLKYSYVIEEPLETGNIAIRRVMPMFCIQNKIYFEI